MILQRLAPVILAHRRYPRTAILLGSSTTITAATCLSSRPYHPSANNSQCNGSDQATSKFAATSSDSLLIPTLQASVRAMRLVTTAFLIVVDYELAKLRSSLLFTAESQEDARIKSLEHALDRAQMEYAREIPDEQKQRMSAKERKELKAEQKRRMQAAAALLADAEETLETMDGGSRRSHLHKRSAQRLLHLCRQNGGVYIKVGQHLANLDYLIPREYIEVLSSLFDDAPQSSFEDVRTVIQKDLGCNVESLFDDFDPVPIASASLAQVHVAYDKKTKRKLAVKVQHRGLRETSAGDIHAVKFVVGVIDSMLKDFTFAWIADEMAPQLPKELDFLNEGRNAERAAVNMSKFGLACCIPKIIWQHSSERVLTMEFEEGFRATNMEELEKSGLKRRDVARLISSVFNSQVFLSGFVHCDPHPGNCLIRKSNKGTPEMVLVDHGLYKQLDDDFRIKYAELWTSLMMADLSGIESACSDLGVKRAYPLFAAMLTARPYDEIIERSKTGSLSAPRSVAPESQADRAVIRGYAKQFMSEIFALLGVVPRQMLLLLKMNDCLRHIDMALSSPANTLVIAGKYASEAVYLNQIQTRGTTTRSKIEFWMDYLKVLCRIQVHDLAAWLMRSVVGRKLLEKGSRFANAGLL